MLTTETGNTVATMGRPLTHRDCMARMPQAAGRAGSAGPWVQVRRFNAGGAFVLCGQVVELNNDSDTGAEWFRVNTCAGPLWAQGKALRMCSGDGRCTCEPAPTQPPGATDKTNRPPIGRAGSTAPASIGINRPKAGTTSQHNQGNPC
jgi:hypothetical protein